MADAPIKPNEASNMVSPDSRTLREVWDVVGNSTPRIASKAFEAARTSSRVRLPLEIKAAWVDAIEALRQGSFDPIELYLRQHGALCAELGLGIDICASLMRALERELLPLIATELHADPSRLTAALLALSGFSARGLDVAARAYLGYKEAELHAREDDLATTLDSIGDGVVVTDADGRVSRMNPVAQRLTGFSIADARSRALTEIFRIESEDTGQAVENPVSRVLREGIVVGLANHTVLVARDGSRCPIADSGAPVRDKSGAVRGVVLVFRDVTEERRAEEKLRYWERVFQHANWGVALADVKEVRFRAVNPAYAAMHGYTVDELLGAPVSTLWTAETRSDMERHAHETHLHGHLVTETTHRCKDGSTLPVEVVAATIRDSQGQVAWFVANVQDITERRRLQQSRIRAIELEARNRRIEEANRMKSEFLANMSHELRTPLNSVIGFTELLHDEQVGPVTSKQQEFLGDILAGGRHLLRLINDVLDLAKVEAGKMDFRPEPVNLEPLVATVAHSLRATAIEKGLEVVLDVDPRIGDVELDPGRFKQVLYNYLSNALKFAPESTRVDVRVTSEGSDNFRLEVEDRGRGIAVDKVPRLFVAFQQLDSAAAKRHGGTGLGLALTRRLAEAQGGVVGVRPATPSGSVFFAVLPRRQGARGHSIQRRLDRAQATRLLVVEPRSARREAVATVLLNAGYEVDATSGFDQAISVWREKPHDGILVAVDGADNVAATFIALVRNDERAAATPVLGMGFPTATIAPQLTGFIAEPEAPEALLEALDRVGPPSPRGRPVLVVDDDVSSLKLMEATLSNLGYSAVCFADPHDALLALPHLRPIAIVIDVIMPDMDGLTFVRRFRAAEQNRRIPVMFWTVKDISAEERRSLESVAELVVQKGVGDGSRLSAALSSLLPSSDRAREQKD